MRRYVSLNDAYQDILRDILDHPDYVSSPRGMPCREKLDYGFKILEPSSSPISTRDPERNIKIAEYSEKEKKLYASLSNRVEDFAKASKFWEKLANADGTINSAYGHLIWGNSSHGNLRYEKYGYMRTPWSWCVQALKADKDTRQAIMRFSLPEHFWIGNKDFTCTLHGDWQIRSDQLHLSMVMRSQDAVKGFVYDAPWFCSLMDKMLEELKTTYPNLTKGTYTHFVHNLHIYEKDILTVKRMLGYTWLEQ